MYRVLYPSLFRDSLCTAKTLAVICKEAAAMPSDSSGWADWMAGSGGAELERERERETFALL